MNNEVLNNLDGERSIPSVNTEITARWKRGAAGVGFICLIATAAGAVHLNVIDKQTQTETPKQKDLSTASSVPPRTFTQLPEPVPVASIEPVAIAAPVAQQPIVSRPVIKTTRPLAPPKPPTPTIDRSASRSSVPVDAGNLTVSNGPTLPQANSNQKPASALLSDSVNSDLGQALKPTRLNSNSATRLSNQDYRLSRGAFIDCALNTRLDSSLPGMTSCVVTRDVFSSNGNVVLIEAGSSITGEYRANVAQGMNRLFVLWSRVETPTGVIINLDSPATGSLGTAGISGHVDTHFWQRFGGAMLLSLIDDAAQIAVNNSSNNNENTQILLGSSGSVASDLAAEVLRNTINIPPTLHVNQGARVGVFVARDLDFSTVYELR